MQRGDVDVLCVVLVSGGAQPLRAQQRNHGARLVERQLAQILALGQHRRMLIEAFLAGNVEHPALRISGIGNSAESGCENSGQLARRQRTDGRIAVVLDEDRRRAAGRMIARPALLLDQHDIEIAGEIGGKPGAGNARPDDRYIGPDRIGQRVHPSRTTPAKAGRHLAARLTQDRPYEKACRGRSDCANAFVSPQSASHILTDVIVLHIKSAAEAIGALPKPETAPMTQPSLVFSDLTLGYSRHPAVHHLSGTVATGSLTAVVGANGSGKSTLMKGIVGVLKPMDGQIVNARNASIAYLPQQSELDRSFPARIVDLVSLGVWPKRGLLGRFTDEDRASVSRALSAVGLEGFEKRPIDTLSGGQLQRALFARVLVQDAEIILLDEPFNAMDTKTVVDLIALIKRWHGESRTIMVVVHDLNLVREHFPETLLLARQPVAWGDTLETLRPENLLRARRFDEAWHDNAPWCEPEGDGHPHGHAHDHDHGHAHAHGHNHDGHGHRHPSGPHAA